MLQKSNGSVILNERQNNIFNLLLLMEGEIIWKIF